jgi:hypothetical protein
MNTNQKRKGVGSEFGSRFHVDINETFGLKTTPDPFSRPKDLSARYVQILTTESPSWIGWWEVEILAKLKAK